jgi:hypothetical protein
MIPDRYNSNDEYFVQEYHLILEQILDVFTKENRIFYPEKFFKLTSNFLNSSLEFLTYQDEYEDVLQMYVILWVY